MADQLKTGRCCEIGWSIDIIPVKYYHYFWSKPVVIRLSLQFPFLAGWKLQVIDTFIAAYEVVGDTTDGVSMFTYIWPFSMVVVV